MAKLLRFIQFICFKQWIGEAKLSMRFYQGLYNSWAAPCSHHKNFIDSQIVILDFGDWKLELIVRHSFIQLRLDVEYEKIAKMNFSHVAGVSITAKTFRPPQLS